MKIKNENTFGARVKTQRKALDITQREAAIRVGVSEVTFGKWERNEHLPKGVLLVKLAALLHVTPEHLLTGDSTQRPGRNKLMQVPVISWAIATLIKPERPVRFSDALEWISTAATISDGCFALRMHDDSMQSATGQPCIPINSLVIIQPEPDPKANSVVLVALADNNCTIKQLRNDAPNEYLRSTNQSYPPIALDSSMRYVGIVKHVMYDILSQ